MIRLTKPESPVELTSSVKRKLIDLYKQEKKAVWKQKYIANKLLEMSNNKCVFCECRLQEEGKYMQVEHFHPKDVYEDEVIEWDNLLPICGRCNPVKNNHDTKIEPIINPTKEDPRDHLYIYNFLMLGKSDIGKLTVDVLDLNNTIGIVQPRFLVTIEIIKKLNEIFDDVMAFDQISSSSRKKTLLKNKMRAIYQEANPKSEYSALVSTVVFSYPDYKKLKSLMQSKEIWDNTLDSLEDMANSIKLEMKQQQEIN